MPDIGEEIYKLCQELFPICRSITGDGVRESLHIIQKHLPEMRIMEVPSGTKAFDWTVPKEWNIREAYIIDPEGKKIIDFQQSNLHVVGYSIPVDITLSLTELQPHLHSLPDQPDAIPYITSYYKPRWGFCLTHNQRETLKPGQYKVLIDSSLETGFLTYGELILPGESKEEIFLSTYICHPSMANNELSGPAVTTYIGKWLQSLSHRKYTYRIIFIPETIGSITYLSKHFDELKRNVKAGFNITCIGDNRQYSYLSSRIGETLADQVTQHVLKHLHPEFISYSYLDRGSDERQYCSPGVDLPVVVIMRSKFGEYPEYHTSLDNLNLICPEGLYGGFEVLRYCVQCLEANQTYQITVTCEPHLGKRGLYPTLSTKESRQIVRNQMNLLAYCDGNHDMLTIADIIEVPMWKLIELIEPFLSNGLLRAYASDEAQNA